MAESIFTAQTPASGDVSEPGGINTAVTFVPAVDGTITGIRFFTPLTISGTFAGSLYLPTADDDPEGSGAGTLLGSAVLGVAPTAGAWNVIPLSPPVPVTAGVPYRAAVHSSSGRYVASGNFFNGVSVVNGNLTAPATGTNSGGFGSLLQGVFRTGALGYPSNTFNGGNYFVDVVFEAEEVAEGEADFPLILSVSGQGVTPAVGAGAAALGLTFAVEATGSAGDPGFTGICGWSIDPEALGVCDEWSSFPASARAAALNLSASFLWGATGRQFGICPTTIRPQQDPRRDPLYRDYALIPGHADSSGGPHLFAGRWFNSGCGTGCCSAGCGVVLRGPVASVDSVMVAGEVLPESAYRVDALGGAYLLIRTDGSCWPTCAREPGDFEVTYGFGRELPLALRVATALLACEYAKGLSGGECALPARMTRLSRQGVDIEVEVPESGAMTGIREVDNVIKTLNPRNATSPSLVLSPDLPESCDRATIWTGA
jgi:hypothetical protein